MIKETKEEFLLENWTRDISMSAKNLGEQLFLQDP